MILVEIYAGCPLDCPYCYARPIADELRSELALGAFQEAVARLSPDVFVLHGQEPFALPLHQLLAIVEAIKGADPGNSVASQTSGLPFTDERKLRFALEQLDNVGFSWDGFGDPPTGRQVYAEQVLGIISTFVKEGKDCGCIWVLTNETSPDALSRGIEALIKAGVKSLRLNPVHYPAQPIEPAHYALLLKHAARYRGDIQLVTLDAILGRVRDCAFSGCCPLGTSVLGVTLDGQTVNCAKRFVTRWSRRSDFRVRLLASLPPALGGCRGCPDFEICKGGCPSTAPDFIHRSALCTAFKEVREHCG